MMLVSAAESLIKVDHGLDLVKSVRYLGELYLQKVLLRCEHFEVICITMLHEELLLVELHSLLGCLPESYGVVDLYSGIEKALAELPFRRLFLLRWKCFRWFPRRLRT